MREFIIKESMVYFLCALKWYSKCDEKNVCIKNKVIMEYKHPILRIIIT